MLVLVIDPVIFLASNTFILFFILSSKCGHIVALVAFSLGLGARSQYLAQAWSLQLDPRSESLPGSGHDVELKQQRGPLAHATVAYV